jgi:serine/threonine-protein kinase
MSSYSNAPPAPELAAGTKIGGRFAVEAAQPPGSFGRVYAVVDERTGKRAAMRLVPAALVRDKEDAERVRSEVKAAASLVHRNVVGTYGLGQEPNGDMFITMEWVDGQHLRALLERRAAGNKRFSLRGAFNVAAHVCHALAHAHDKQLLHGSLSPHHVFVSRTGRVKVAGFALSRILPTLRGLSAEMRTYLLAYLPPEARGARGVKLTPRADVFSLAVVLFELLGGKPRPGIVPNPAALGEQAPPAVRAVLERALNHDPSMRHASAQEFEEALSAELQKLGEIQPADDDLRLDVEVDLGGPAAAPPPAAPGPALTPARVPAAPPPSPNTTPARLPAAPPPSPKTTPARLPAAGPISGGAIAVGPVPAAEGGAGALLRAAASSGRSSQVPARGSRVSVEEEFRKPEPAAAEAAAPALPITGRASSVDFGSVLSSLDADDVERWMLQKDKLDHGPFRDRELAEMILKGAALGDHNVTNLETGVRCKLKQVEPFKPFLEKYKVRKKQQEEQEALKRSVRVERMGFAAKVAIALGIAVAVAGTAVGLYYGLRTTGSSTKQVREDQQVASGGPLQVDGVQAKLTEASLEAQPPPTPEQKKKRRSGSRRSGSGSGRAAGGLQEWDSAWNAGGDLDLGSGDSAPILTAREINAKMRSKQGALFSCVRAEMGRNPGMSGQISIEMLIRGHDVVAARVPGHSGALESCIQGVLSSVHFDSQAYGQMRSAFSMEVVR